jgi:UDP-N-acetylglucosamine--N-acetylmuramyl-(pentapeptide) pyrophosphoryl-undecaprenol N-acetylglucosamine transferase
MKILFTGGGSGGHFYPVIAVAEQVRAIAKAEKLVHPQMYFMGPDSYDDKALYENDIKFRIISAGKLRRYFSIKNFFDLFKTGWGILKAIIELFFIFPDVIFSNGGYGSFPILVAGKLFGIPIVLHVSDLEPGRVHNWAGKFAKKIAISFPETARHFDEKKVAFTGNPIRKELLTVTDAGAYEFLKLEKGIPTILVLGGSQGAQKINTNVFEALPVLLNSFQVIHQVGKDNVKAIEETAEVLLKDNEHKERYKPFGFLNILALRMAAGATDVVITRAGSGSIFEIAVWGIPAIVIPIPEDVSHDQRKNAFAYARSGAAVVVEEENLTPNILKSEIERLTGDEGLKKSMSQAAKDFSKPDAATKIARELIRIALSHEKS